ncbi:MAG: NYN domain-containing protein [Treponema sp.]|jgi:hypothetical protein|nr:NYN domain-containing protein [Treponema sp.]
MGNMSLKLAGKLCQIASSLVDKTKRIRYNNFKENLVEYTVCAMYIDLENNIPSNINIKRLIEEIILRNKSVNNSDTVFAVKMACGNKSSIEKLESKLSEYNFDIRNITKITSNYKNRADLIISLEAFETLIINKPVIEKYIFITSDSDFTVIMEKLRKHGKQVWLVTNVEASQKPIFNNTCNEIFTFDKFIDSNENNFKTNEEIDSSKTKEENIHQDISEDKNNLRAIEAFKRVLEILEHDKWYYNATIGSNFHQIDKSLDLKNTRFKNIGNLVLYFQDKQLVETRASDKGHIQLRLL